MSMSEDPSILKSQWVGGNDLNDIGERNRYFFSISRIRPNPKSVIRFGVNANDCTLLDIGISGLELRDQSEDGFVDVERASEGFLDSRRDRRSKKPSRSRITSATPKAERISEIR